MGKGIDALQSLYARSGKSFSDGLPSDVAGGSRHNVRQDPGRPQSAGREAPSCPKSVDSHACGRGNSSGHRSRRGGSKYAPRESDDYRWSPPRLRWRRKNLFSRESELVRVEDLDRASDELRADYDHERSRRLSLRDLVQTNSHEFLKFNAKYYSSLVENKRSIHSLHDELKRAITRLSFCVSRLTVWNTNERI